MNSCFMQSESIIRKEICHIGYKLYERNYIIATDGNISARLPGNIILITPSGVCKGEMTSDQILKIDIDGNRISGQGKPSSETHMHLSIYRKRPDARVVVHAHPPTAVALSVSGITLEKVLVPEVLIHVGKIPTAPYATPGTPELAKSIEYLIEHHDAILLERHGMITVGTNLNEAYYKLECSEYAARIAWMANQVGTMSPLDTSQINTLLAMRK